MSTPYQDLANFSDDADNFWTLPGRYYYDEAIYADELEQIFTVTGNMFVMFPSSRPLDAMWFATSATRLL